MSDHNHGSHRWDLEPSAEPGAHLDHGPASRWGTIESSLNADEVREHIRRALAPRQPLAYGAVTGRSETRQGFLLRFKSRGRLLFGEVQLAAWEGGTQVHIVVPAEQKRRDYEVLVGWVRQAVKA